MHVFFRSILVAVCLFSFQLHAQTIQLLSPAANTGVSRCGNSIALRYEFSNFGNVDTLLNLNGSFVLNNGLTAQSVSAISGHSNVTLGAGNTLVFTNDTLLNDSILVFEIIVQASCSASVGNAGVTSINISYTNGNSNVSTSNAGVLNIQTPNPVINPGDVVPGTLQAYLGLMEDIVVTITNADNGSLDTFYHCVDDHPNAAIQSVTAVGATSVTNIGANGGYENCYRIVAPLGSNGTIDVTESWLITSCPPPGAMAPDLERKTSYGCQGSISCTNNPSAIANSGINFDNSVPILNVTENTAARVRPGCYASQNTIYEMVISHAGMSAAPAKDIIVQISATGGDFDLGQYTITGDATPETIIDILPSTGCGSNVLIDTIRDVNLEIGESITIHYEFRHSCSCGSCGIRNIYATNFEIQGATNPCDLFNGLSANRSRGSHDAFLSGFGEAPSDAIDGEKIKIDYTITDAQLDWLSSGGYPNAYMEMDFLIPCGLDYQSSTISWTDDDNDSFMPSSVLNITPVAPADPDTLRVRWNRSDFTSGFDVGTNMLISYCAVVDCSEKSPTCANTVFDVDINARTYFSVDPTCPEPCAIREIFCPSPISISIFCENLVGCPPCDGMIFREFGMARTNFGEPDAGNDQTRDGSTLDPNLVFDNRFLQGDSIKATFVGLVQDLDDSELFTHGFAEVYFDHSNLTPLSAELIVDDNDGVLDTCTTIPYFLDIISPTNTRLVVDFSIDTIQNFGCMSGLNPLVGYDQGDTIKVCMYFKIKDPATTEIEQILYNTRFYLSDDVLDAGIISQCNTRRARLTQVGFSSDESRRFRNFGACDVPGNNRWRVIEERYIGFENVDEFPFEIRSYGIPEQISVVKSPEFIWLNDQFRTQLIQKILTDRNLLTPNIATIPVSFISIVGDTATFYAKAYFESLGLPTIYPDEGFDWRFYPKIQGTCQSEVGRYPIAMAGNHQVDEQIFCTNTEEITSFSSTFRYTEAANLLISTALTNVTLCGGEDQVAIQVQNAAGANATFAFLSWSSPTGGGIVNRIEDIGGNEIVPNAFGIYELGSIMGNQTINLNAFISANNCENQTIDFFTGWDCSEYPTTVFEAICSQPSSIEVKAANSGMNLDVIMPSSDQIANLCEEVTYEIEVRSTLVGFLRDAFVKANIPPSQTYVAGSLQISIPGSGQGGVYMNAPIDATYNAGVLEIPVSAQDADLLSQGLVGSKDVSMNTVTLRFRTRTECGYASGSRLQFTLEGANACGDPLVPVTKNSSKLLIDAALPNFSTSLIATGGTINVCNPDTITTTVTTTMVGGSPTSLDSIRVLLPDGFVYVAGSVMPIVNFTSNPPVVSSSAGNTILTWPLTEMLEPGDQIRFKIDISAIDAGQSCSENLLFAQVFASTNALCMGSPCAIKLLAGEASIPIQVVKPNLVFNSFEAELDFSNAPIETMNYDIEICNQGAILMAGNTISIDVYEDVDRNGFNSAGDLLVVTIDSILTQNFNFGDCMRLQGSINVTPGLVCVLIGEMSPDNVCVCNTQPSDQVRPSFVFPVINEVFACSSTALDIGPDAVTGFDYEWIGLNGASTTFLSNVNTTPTLFNLPNNTGSNLTYQYALRSSRSNCFNYDTITLILYPVIEEEFNVRVCEDASYDFPVPFPGGSNFNWMANPPAALNDLIFLNPMDSSNVRIDMVTASTDYSLTFIDANGCDGSYDVNITAIDCGGANTGLGDTVWFDYNMNGLQDIGEPGIQGVTVNLYDANTLTIVGTKFTDANGYYTFDTIPPGNYFVEFIPLPGFIGTIADVNGALDDDDDDSDASTVTGRTGNYLLPLSTYNPTIDAGFIPNCSVEMDMELSACVPFMGALRREATINVTWNNNVYTYDQFDGMDSFMIKINETLDTLVVVADTLSGTQQITFPFDASVGGTLELTGRFLIDTMCADTVMAINYGSCMFDLALKKEDVNIPNPLRYGDTVELRIVVYNQGSSPATKIVVNEYLPSGFGFIPALNSPWSNIGGGLYKSIVSDTLLMGESDTMSLFLTVQMTSDPANGYTNYSEISSFQDTLGNDQSAYDVDSTPDDIVNNDAGGRAGTNSDNALNGNGMGMFGDPSDVTDEDDHDVFKLQLFDVALRKTLVDLNTSVMSGDTVGFFIDVINQGPEPMRNVAVQDYIRGGFIFDAALNPTWDLFAAPARAIDTIAVLDPTDTVRLTIKLIVEFSATSDYINYAEISSYEDTLMTTFVSDIDSDHDNIFNNDAGGNPSTGSNNALNGSGTGTFGDGDPFTDEDGHDGEQVTLLHVSDCICLDNATNLIDGQFLDTITIRSEAGRIWYFSSATNLYTYNMADMRHTDTLKGNADVTMATTIPEIMPGIYQIIVVHNDAMTYTATLTNDRTSAQISNACYYPNPSLIIPESPFCNLKPIATINGVAERGDGTTTTGTTIYNILDQDSMLIQANVTQIIPSTLMPGGKYFVEFIFMATDEGPLFPGCTSRILVPFELLPVGCGNFPWKGE